MKKRVVIIYSGQMRTNSLGINVNDNVILKSTDKFLLNEEFKSKYEFDVFISTDSVIDISKAMNYFGDHLKNIQIIESDWQLKQFDSYIPNIDFFYDKYLNKNNNGNIHLNGLIPYYRLYKAIDMVENYQLTNHVKYDFIIKIRPDVCILQNIMKLMDILEASDTKIITEHDHLSVIKYDLINIFKVINCYGKYVDDKDLLKYAFMSPSGDINLNDFLAPERQFINHIFSIINLKQLEWSKSFLGIKYGTFNAIYRENGTFAYL